MANNIRAKSHMWTIKEIETVHKLWKDSSPEEIAEEIGVSVGQVKYVAHEMRKEGIKVPKKTRIGQTRGLIKEYASSL